MLRANRTFLNPRFDHAMGGLANESRYDGVDDPDMERKHKRFVLPTMGGHGRIWFEAGWNRLASQKDIVKIIIEDIGGVRHPVIIRRIDLEQMVMAMAQGDEAIKYVGMQYRSQRDLPKK